MTIEEFIDSTEAGQRQKAKQKALWERVSIRAKENKLKNKKSKRDIEREKRIEALGGTPIIVEYGFPLLERDRLKRIELEIDLKWPNRKQNEELRKEKQKKILKELRSPRGSRRTFEQVLKSSLRTAKARAERYQVPFDISVEDLEVGDYCPVFGTKFSWGNKITKDTPSLDRVVPELGYVKGNVRVISMKANRAKSNSSVEELEKILEYMKCHQ